MQPLDGGALRGRITRSRLEILPMPSRRNVAASLLAIGPCRAGSAGSRGSKTMLDASVRIHGLDMAILTTRSPILNRDVNKHYDFRWIQVFTKISGQWRLAQPGGPCCSVSRFQPRFLDF